LVAGCDDDPNSDVDASCPLPDMAGGTKCGANTMLNATNNTCEIASSACQAGTEFDSTAFACRVSNPIYGTRIHSSPYATAWTNLYFSSSNADAGTTACSTGTCERLGTALGVLMANPPPDSTPTFLKAGTPIGRPASGNYPIHWETGNVSTTPSAVEHQTTLGDWKTCTGSWAVYNNPPSGKKTYFVVVDLAGCQPGLVFSVWGVASNTKAFANVVNAFPLGGVPNSLEIDAAGKGHWEREIDPNIFFKSGVVINGNAHNPAQGQGAIPDITVNTNASFWPALNIHASGQSNGNPGACERDGTTNCNGGPCCVTPPSPNIFLPGVTNVDAIPVFVGPEVMGQPQMPIPFSMLQPY
jgi:hypothetical protein